MGHCSAGTDAAIRKVHDFLTVAPPLRCNRPEPSRSHSPQSVLRRYSPPRQTKRRERLWKSSDRGFIGFKSHRGRILHMTDISSFQDFPPVSQRFASRKNDVAFAQYQSCRKVGVACRARARLSRQSPGRRLPSSLYLLQKEEYCGGGGKTIGATEVVMR